MKLTIKNKVMSLRGSSTVTDEQGNDVCKVAGKFISLTNKKRIYDNEGNLKYVVKDKFWHFINHKTFVIDDEKNKVAVVIQKPFSFKQPYEIQSMEDDLQFVGDDKWRFPNVYFDVEENGKKIGHIQKDVNFLTDAYYVEVEDEKQVYLLVALVIAIDNVIDKARKNK